MEKIIRYGIKILLFSGLLFCTSCAPAPKQSFIIGPKDYLDAKIEVAELLDRYTFTESISMNDGIQICFDATVDIPTIEVTSFIVSPNALDINKLLKGCMGTDISNVECIATKEGFQSGYLYTYNGYSLAINNDDGFFTYFPLNADSHFNQYESSNMDRKTLINSALIFAKECGLSDNICKTPEKILYNEGSGLYEITFGKQYYGIKAEPKSYVNIASTQGFPVDGEFITFCISPNGIESFNGITKKVIQIENISSIVHPQAIINNFDRYVMLVPFSIGEKLTIDHIELKYLATPIAYEMWSVRYVLAWYFSGITDENMPYFLYINALDGTLI